MNKIKTQKLVLISLFVALLCVSSLISIPLPFSPTPITLQTMFINIAALALSPLEAGLTIFVYLLLGMVGLPVFSGGTGGIARFAGPTGGYLVGYLIAAVVISLIKGRRTNYVRYLLSTIIGVPIIYLLGNITMCMYLKTPYFATFAISTVPYLIGDALKCASGSYVAYILNKQVIKKP